MEAVDNGKRAEPTPPLVFYDFGQAVMLNQDQADGILDVNDRSIDGCLGVGRPG